MLAILCTAMTGIIGCGENEEDAAFMSAHPPNNSTIAPEDTIIVTFENTPLNLYIESRGETYPLWELNGRTLTIRGNTYDGKWTNSYASTIIITWATGRKILNYSVRSTQLPPKPVAEATFDGATPASGGELAANQDITLKFTGSPGTITADAGTVSGRTIAPPDGGFALGELTINITWENGPDDGEGSASISYTVISADETAPEVTDTDPANGAKNLDPAVVFEDTITITFNEAIAKTDIKLMDDGTDVGWTVSIDGDTVTLTGNAGKDLSYETEYTVEGTATDNAGNKGFVSFSFTTKAKD